MTARPEFDFKDGQNYYRGHGNRALFALVIVRWRWPVVLIGGVLTTIRLMAPWVLDFLRHYAH